MTFREMNKPTYVYQYQNIPTVQKTNKQKKYDMINRMNQGSLGNQFGLQSINHEFNIEMARNSLK